MLSILFSITALQFANEIPKYSMHYSISETSLQTRKNNIFLGALLSLVLVVVITAGHFQYPETYNDMVFWSVIVMVAVGNLVNYYRYRRYLCLVKDHRIEIDGDEVSFFTGTEKSVLDTKEIVALTFYCKKGQVEHIQLKLRNNRGVRLEGYTDLEQLGDSIADQIPKELVVGREP
ncbi:MAG: hypothetical protein ABFS24_13105 [Pseudomonadota bacterium]